MKEDKIINLIWQTSNGDQTNFEYEYITEVLFKNFEQNKIFDNGNLQSVLDNSVIIYSNNSTFISADFEEYLNKFTSHNFKFYLLHLSNENLNHNCDYYSKANHVFRSYYDPNISEENVSFIPLGFKSGFLNFPTEINKVEKEFDFAFIGQVKSDRANLVSILNKIDNVFIHTTNSWNCPTSLSQQDCKKIYEKTKFVPCPMGWIHPDSFRIWECLESKSIPILKRYNNIDYFEKTWEDSPLPVINSWQEISNLSNLSDEEYRLLFERVHKWFDKFKISLSELIFNKIQNYKNEVKKIKLMKTYNTDKFTHGYMEIYEPLFKSMKESKKVLEIGVYHGESLNLLELNFPEAKIYGIDIENKCHLDDEKIKTFICNQESREDLKKVIESVGDDLDLIIDDGGHTMKQQQISFGYLFSKLKSGGIYILEDLHTSRLEQLGTITKNDLITTLDMLFNLKYTGNLLSNYILDEEKKYIENNLEYIKIWTANSEYNRSVTSIIKKK